MSPCFQGDPPPGFLIKESGPYASQEECDDDCSILGACCTPQGCIQTTRCNCRKEDGKNWLGVGISCTPDPCDCECDLESCGFTEGSKATITFFGFADREEFCTQPPASSINGRPICMEFESDSFGNFCLFSTRPSCLYYYGGQLPENILNSIRVAFCFSGEATRGFLYASGWGVSSGAGFGSCDTGITINNLSNFTNYYDTSEAYCVVTFEECELPEASDKTCCSMCTEWGDTPVNQPDSIDVTISNVASNNPGLTGDIQAFVEGTYTLTRSGCDYVFSKYSGATMCFPSTPLYALGIRLTQYRNLEQSGCENGFRWLLSVVYDTPIFGCVPSNVSSRLMFYQQGNVLHDIPTCCVAESFSLTGVRFYTGWTADFEVHCD